MNRKRLRFLFFLFLSALVTVCTSSAASGTENVTTIRPKIYLSSPYSSLSMEYGDSEVIPCLEVLASNRTYSVSADNPDLIRIDDDGKALTAVGTGHTKLKVCLHFPDEVFEYYVDITKARLHTDAEGYTVWQDGQSEKSQSITISGWKLDDQPEDYVNYNPPEISPSQTESHMMGEWPAVVDFSNASLPSDGSGESCYEWDQVTSGTYTIGGTYESDGVSSGDQNRTAGQAEEESDIADGSPQPEDSGEPQTFESPVNDGSRLTDGSSPAGKDIPPGLNTAQGTGADGDGALSQNTDSKTAATGAADTSAPVVSLSGVEDRSSNSKELSVQVTVTDESLDAERCTAALKGENEGSINGTAVVSKNNNTMSVSYETIHADDHYILKVHAYDLAGNRTDKEYRFTKNTAGTEFTCCNLTDRNTGQDFSPSVRLENLDPQKIISVTINGTDVPYTFSGGVLAILPENTDDGKNRLMITCTDAAGNLSVMAPFEFYRGELPNEEDCDIINTSFETDSDAADTEKAVSGKRYDNMKKHQDKKLFAMMIVVGILVLACVGILIGMKIGNAKRNEISQAAVDSRAAESKALLDSRTALDESAKAESDAKAAAEASSKAEAEKKQASEILAQQTKEGNLEDAETLKGVVSIGLPNVATYADAKKNASVISADTVDSGASSASKATGANGHTVCIDAGHQLHTSDSQYEANGPGSDTTKLAVSSGTSGVSTGMEEYELNLEVALKLQAELEKRGYTVVMTRTENDVHLTNIDRAKIANDSGADIMVRIHANSSDDSSVAGALTYAPATDNPYLSSDIISRSTSLATDVINAFCGATGASNRGLLDSNELTGINWSTIPVTYLEMGFMSNPTEDEEMASADYQAKMVQGIANGIDTYFSGT